MTAKAQIEAAVDVDRHALGRQHTLSSWCDRTLGTAMTVQVNEQMIKWCGAFLDEGQATWVMPLREHTLYGAWKVLVRHDLSLSILGVPDMRRKVEQLPQRPEDAILEILDALAVPKLLWQDYLTLHLAALPGWTGFIKWRAHQGDYDWRLSDQPVQVPGRPLVLRAGACLGRVLEGVGHPRHLVQYRRLHAVLHPTILSETGAHCRKLAAVICARGGSPPLWAIEGRF
ncbi:MAG: hypothetical protein C4293_09590 [Nitrospiraceae bacterium]